MKKLIVIASIGMCLCGNAQSQRVVCDGNSCRIEPAGGAMGSSRPIGDAGYTVVSPVGRSAIKPSEHVSSFHSDCHLLSTDQCLARLAFKRAQHNTLNEVFLE